MGDLPTNFIDLYIHQHGESEAPRQWLQWTAISMMAAVFGDHVFYYKGDDSTKQLTCGLYIWLIGTSGSGKGAIIETVADYLPDEKQIRNGVGLCCDRQTGPAIWGSLSDMAKIQKTHYVSVPTELDKTIYNKIYDQGRLYLVHPEIAQGLHQGEHGHSFCMNMIILWDDTKLPVGEKTKGRGGVKFKKVSLSWLAGSTKDEIRDLFPHGSSLSGFFARVIPVWGERSQDPLYPEIIYPSNVQEARLELRERMERYHAVDLRGKDQLAGPRIPLTFNDDAKTLKRELYLIYRQSGFSAEEEPYYNRWEDIVIKLSIIMRLSDWDGRGVCPTVMELSHLERAVALWNSIRSGYTNLNALMNSTTYSEEETRVLQAIKTSKEREDNHWKYLPINHKVLWGEHLSKMRVAVLCEALTSLERKGLIEWINPVAGFKQERAEMYKYIGEDKKEE